MDLLLDNTRVPQEREGDLDCPDFRQPYRRGAAAGGLCPLWRYPDRLHEGAGGLLRAPGPGRVSSLPDGVYTYTDYVDGCGDKYPDPLPIHVSVTVKGDDLIFLYVYLLAEQIKAPINVPYPCTQAAVFFAVKALMGDDIPANEGINRAVTLIAPKGCIVNPTEPSPVGAQIDCEQRIPDAIFGALAPIFPTPLSPPETGPAPPPSCPARAPSAQTASSFSTRSLPAAAEPPGTMTACPVCR